MEHIFFLFVLFSFNIVQDKQINNLKAIKKKSGYII